MKCSACRDRLDAYLEGDLQNGVKLAVAGHLATCAACSEVAQSLRVVTQSLERVRDIEPRVDFATLVMARVTVMPAPRPAWQGRVLWAAAYVTAAWAIVALAVSTHLLSWQSVLASTGAFAGKLGATAGTFYRIGEHFHLVGFAAMAAGAEIALVVVLAAAGRAYLARRGTTLLGARLT